MYLTFLRLAFAAAAAVLVTGCWPFVQRHIITSQISPDERHIATSYQVSAGPPARHRTSVAVRVSDRPFSARPEDAVFTVDGPYAVGILWDGGSHLKVVCIGCPAAAILKHQERSGDLTVSVERYGAAQ